MGIVSFIIVCIAIAAMWTAVVWISYRGHLMAAAILMTVAIVSSAWFINAFVTKIYSPADGPVETDLPRHDRQRNPAPEIDHAPEKRPDTFDKAENEHRDRLKRFSGTGTGT